MRGGGGGGDDKDEGARWNKLMIPWLAPEQPLERLAVAATSTLHRCLTSYLSR